MGKFDTASRMARGIQPGLAPIPPNMGNNNSPMQLTNQGPALGGMNMGNNPMQTNPGMSVSEGPMIGDNSNLLSPSFESVMNKNPNMNNAVNNRAIGARPSITNRLNNNY